MRDDIKEAEPDTSARSARWTLLIAALASFLVALDTMVMMTALADIRDSLGASLRALEWSVNAYNLTFAVLLTIGAALGERFGRLRLFVIGLVLFAMASVACALSTSIEGLIAARALQGASGAIIMPIAMALLGGAFPGAKRGPALGIFASITGLAVLGGPMAGGFIVETLRWNWIFWINLPIGLALAALALWRVRDSSRGRSAFDASGVALIAAAALSVTFGLTRSSELGWGSPIVLSAFALALALILGFIWWQGRAREPVLPRAFFAAPRFRFAIIAAFAHYGALYSTLFFAAQFMQVGLGATPFGAGLRLLPWTATLFVVAPIAGRLMNRVGEKVLVATGTALQALSLGLIAVAVQAGASYAMLAVLFVGAGVGASLTNPSLQSAVIGAVAPPMIGKASGVYSMAQFLGGMMGIALAVTIFAQSGSDGSAAGFQAGFVAAITLSASLSFIALIVALFIPGRPAAQLAVAA